MAVRKTAAQKAAEAAERDEYTGTTAASDPAVEAPAKKETVQQLKNRLRNEAEREVLNKHKHEVIKITEAKYDEHNLEYVRRLSEEEKAAKVIEEMYQKFPNLRPATTVVVPDPAERVEAVPGGALEQFRAEDHEPEDPGYFAEYQPDGR